MGGVRFVAGILGFIGWFTLVIGALAILFVASQMGSGQGVMTAAPAIVALVFLTLGPLFLWGVLTGLCELHAQGERILLALRSGGSTPSADRPERIARPPLREATPRVERKAAPKPTGEETPARSDTSDAPEWAPASGQQMRTVTRSTLMDGMGYLGQSLMTLSGGTSVTVLSVTGGWGRVRTSRGDEGFLELDVLEPAD